MFIIKKSAAHFFRLFYSLMMFCIFLICVFFSEIKYACKIEYNNPVLLIYGLILLFVLLGLSNIIADLLDKYKLNYYVLYVIPVFFLIIQLYAISSYYFYTNWDVKAVITISDHIAHNPGRYSYEYLSRYPNNSLLAWFFSLFYRFVYALHGKAEVAYKLILFTQCALNSLTGYFLVLIIKRLFNKNYLCVYGYILYVLLIGCSPWVSIPYSDSMGLFFPILILFFLQKKFVGAEIKLGQNTIGNIFWICVLVYLGYCIKPQIILCWLAFMFLKYCCPSISHAKNNAKIVLITLFSIILSFICSAVIVHRITGSLYQPDKSFGAAHFLMMGMNAKSGGVFNWEDVSFSESFDTNEERRSAACAVVNNRVKAMGTFGIIKHLYRKTLTSFNDGTFYWGGEGSFYDKIRENDDHNTLSSFLRDIYYNGQMKGKYNNIWSDYVQAIWLSILCFSCFAAFCKNNDVVQIITITTIIGLVVFLLLFEARARYLYVYAPYFILLSVFGIHNISYFVKEKFIS